MRLIGLYISKFKKCPEKLAESNPKIMQNILTCGQYLSNWDDSINQICEIGENCLCNKNPTFVTSESLNC